MPQLGWPVVHIRLAEQGAAPVRDRRMIEFLFRDTGPDIGEKIFEPFTQADASTTRRFGCTGLGRAIVMRLTGPGSAGGRARAAVRARAGNSPA